MTFTHFTDDNKVVPGVTLIGPDGEPYKASFQVVEGGTIDTDILAKEAKQDTGNTHLAAIDTKLGGTLNAAVTATSLPLPTGAASSANQNTIIAALNNEYALLGAGINVTVQNASMPVTVASLPLPAGAATSAKQDSLQAAIDDGIDVNVSNTVPITMANRAVTVSNPVEISNTTIGVTDAGGSLTVDGTVAATQSGTWTSTLAPDATVAVSTIGSPVAVTDNGQSLTVDGTVGVSGVVQIADNGGSVTVDATSLPLPTGAATAANQATEISSLANIDFKFPPQGQTVKVNSLPVVLASDQGTLPVSLAANQSTNTAQVGGVSTAVGAGASNTGTQRVVLASDSTLASNQSVNLTQLNGVSVVTGAGPAGSAGVQRINLTIGSTASLAEFAGSTGGLATSQTFLAAGSTRQGVLIANDTDVVIYIRFGATAVTTTSYSVKLAVGAIYEVPRGLVGIEIRGIGASAGTTGAVHITSVV